MGEVWAVMINFFKELDSNDWLFHASFGEMRFLKWRDVINSIFFGDIKRVFRKFTFIQANIFFLVEIKTDFNKNRYFMCQILMSEC